MTQRIAVHSVRALVLSWFILASGCGKPVDNVGKANPLAAPGAQAEAAPVDVVVVHPVKAGITRVIEQPGYTEAFEQTAIFNKIDGYVHKVHVDIGDRVKGPVYDEKDKDKLVKKGRLLAELWVPELVQELKQKSALIDQAKAEVEQTRQTFEVARANVETAQAMVKEAQASRQRAQANASRWHKEYERVTKLVESKVIDKQTRDETENQYESARAGEAEAEAKVLSMQAAVNESQARQSKAQADVDTAKSKVQVAEAERDRVQALLDYSKLYAPFDGVVTARHVNTGDFLPSSGKGIKGEPLFVVSRQDPMRIFVDMPETDAASIVHNKTHAVIHVRGLSGQSFAGEVTRNAWGLDRKSRTLRIEIDVANPKGILLPGMYVQAAITVKRGDVWTLPVQAVVLKDAHPYCIRVESGKAVKTLLHVGISDGKRIEVVKQQTAPGKDGGEGTWQDFTGKDAIVTGNPEALSDGQPVREKAEK